MPRLALLHKYSYSICMSHCLKAAQCPVQEDRDDIQSSIHEMQSAAAARGAAWQPELGSGQVLLLRRAVLAESGPITGFDLRAALAAAFRAACALHPEALLFEVHALASLI